MLLQHLDQEWSELLLHVLLFHVDVPLVLHGRRHIEMDLVTSLVVCNWYRYLKSNL